LPYKNNVGQADSDDYERCIVSSLSILRFSTFMHID